VGFAEPLTEAELLTAQILQVPRANLLARDHLVVEPEEFRNLSEALNRRSEGEPLAYIVGYKDFYKHRFLVSPGVLIPRPETEHLVETALRHVGESASPNIFDFGCGSGCIGISLLKAWPHAQLIAVDLAAEAVSVTVMNAELLGVRLQA